MSWYQGPAVPTRRTTDGQAVTGAGVLKAVCVDGAGAVVIYDNTAASGTVLWQGSGANNVFFGDEGVAYSTGVFVDLTGNTVITYTKS